MWKRPIKAAVHVGLDQPRLRAFVEADLKTSRPPRPDETPRDDGMFVDRHGVSHPLDLGLRDRLKPEWRSMLDPEAASRPPSDQVLRRRARKAVGSAREASTAVGAATGTPLTGRILEVGVGEGEVTARLAERWPDATFCGVDLPDPELAGHWDGKGFSPLFGDIGRLPFEDDTFDLVLAIEVLEHVPYPELALA